MIKPLKIAEFNDAENGVRSVVMLSVDGLFDVAAFDTDAAKMIEARHGFKTQDAAVAYAQKFVVAEASGAIVL